MSVADAPKSQALLSRVQNILLRPNAEWDAIAAEGDSPPALVTGYAAPLAAIPAVGLLIGRLLPHCYGFFFVGGCLTRNPASVVVGAALFYGLLLGVTWLTGLAIEALAPSFGAQANRAQAMKLAVYAQTPFWLAGVFLALPGLGVLAILGVLYAAFLLTLGAPKLMKPATDTAVAYAVVAALILAFLVAVAFAIAASVTDVGGGLRQVRVGGTMVDADKARAAARQLEADLRGAGEGKGDQAAVQPLDLDKLKALLPASVAGLPRTDTAAESGTAHGVGAAYAEASYSQGARRVTLRISDIAAMRGLAALAGAVHAQESRETPTGYEKAGNIGGRWTVERYDRQSQAGEYSLLVGDRFELRAEGEGVSIDDLKAAVAATGPDRLEALAHG